MTGGILRAACKEAQALDHGRERVMAMDQPMRRMLVSLGAVALASAVLSAAASGPRTSSAPMFECGSSGSLRVTCRGSFSDGTSAAGIVVRVLDKTDHIVYAGLVDRHGRVSFRKPDAQFSVVFDAGEGNVLTLLGSEMI